MSLASICFYYVISKLIENPVHLRFLQITTEFVNKKWVLARIIWTESK